jgi:putative FmdB family regulatory protein
MPLYDYACTKCGRVHEIRHGFDETPEGRCDACGAPLRRVFNPAPILFKGSGFYVTDSRQSASSAKPEKSKDEPAADKSTAPPKTEAGGGTKPSEPAA